MFINVRAHNPGHAGTFTPGRFWPNGAVQRLEVVEDDVARQQIKPIKGMAHDPAVMELRVAEGPYLSDGKPDPERITRVGLDAIKHNQHLSILGDDESQGAAGHAAVDAARGAAAKANAELVDAKVYVAELEAELKKLTEDNAALKARIAELEAAAPKAKGKTSDKGDGSGESK